MVGRRRWTSHGRIMNKDQLKLSLSLSLFRRNREFSLGLASIHPFLAFPPPTHLARKGRHVEEIVPLKDVLRV